MLISQDNVQTKLAINIMRHATYVDIIEYTQ